MPLDTMQSLLVVAITGALGYLLGMIHAGWIITIKAHQAGLRFDERLNIIRKDEERHEQE